VADLVLWVAEEVMTRATRLQTVAGPLQQRPYATCHCFDCLAPCCLDFGSEAISSRLVSRRPGLVGSAAARKADTDVAAEKAVLAAARRVDGVVAVAAVRRLAGRPGLSEVRHESPEDVAVQVGAAMQSEQGGPAADESLGFAGAETGEVAQIAGAAAAAAVGNGCSEGDRPAVIALEIADQLAVVDYRRCVAAVRCLDRTAERSQAGGLELIAEGRTGMRPNSETAE